MKKRKVFNVYCLTVKKTELVQQELTEDSLAMRAVFSSSLSSSSRGAAQGRSPAQESKSVSSPHAQFKVLQTIVETHFTDTVKTLKMRGVIKL